MNIFDSNFHGLEPKKSRPFSYGHPDGVWMISIVYFFAMLLAVGGVLMGLINLIKGDVSALGLIAASLVAFTLHFLSVRFLFLRSEKALLPLLAILVIVILGAAVSYVVNPAGIVPVLIVLAIQLFICYYVNGLRKEKLLFGEEKISV